MRHGDSHRGELPYWAVFAFPGLEAGGASCGKLQLERSHSQRRILIRVAHPEVQRGRQRLPSDGDDSTDVELNGEIDGRSGSKGELGEVEELGMGYGRMGYGGMGYGGMAWVG